MKDIQEKFKEAIYIENIISNEPAVIDVSHLLEQTDVPLNAILMQLYEDRSFRYSVRRNIDYKDSITVERLPGANPKEAYSSNQSRIINQLYDLMTEIRNTDIQIYEKEPDVIRIENDQGRHIVTIDTKE